MKRARAAAVAALLGAGALAAGGTGAATGDAAALQRGEQLYARCAGCHAIEANRTGPQHCGLFGRRAGNAPGYDAYSAAMSQSGIVWDARTLDRFLRAPTSVVPGTTMGYAGIKDAGERADLITWLSKATRAGLACRLAR